MSEPDLIKHLRTCSVDPDNMLTATIKGSSCKGLGIRPKVLSYGEDGINIYGLSGKQVDKLIKLYDSMK